MFQNFPNFLSVSFQSELESSLTQSGHNALVYADANRFAIKQQVLTAHEDTRYSNLKLKKLNHRAAQGRKVLALEGTIPITHQNGQYNIPVEVVLPPDFPFTAPEVYVRPTYTMVVASDHPFVEASSGAVNTPSIVSWTHPRSNLTSCLTELSAEFGTQSPVYARSATTAPPVASFPVPSYGTGAFTPGPSTPAVQNPYPSTGPSDPYVTNPLRPNASPNPPARPAAPTASMFPVYPPDSSSYPPANANPYITGGTTTSGGGAPPVFSYNASAAAAAAQQAAAGGAPNPPPPDKTSSMAEFRRCAVESLVQRLGRSIEQSEHLIGADTDKLLDQAQLVEANRKVISDACAEKKAELQSLERNVTVLSSATQALHGWIKVNEAKITALPETVAPADVIVPVDDLSQQAMAAQAEDMAIEESLELLQEALKGRAADLEVVMRLGRQLAQKQFYCRALGAKLQKMQRQRHSTATQVERAYSQAGVLLPMGDAWSRVSTYTQ